MANKKTLTQILFDEDKNATGQTRLAAAVALVAGVRAEYTEGELPDLTDFRVVTTVGEKRVALLEVSDRVEMAKREVTGIKAEASAACEHNPLLDFNKVVRQMIAANAPLNALAIEMPDSVI